eukprot:COSAG04_NODE_881_length_9663_cov_30.524258_4_plen_483_part_00
MLMYRRKDPELNIRSVGEADLPATLTAEIAATVAKEAAEKEREREETERKHRVLELTAFGPESAADIELEKSATLAQATALVRKALGIGDDVAPDCVRLREWSKYDNVTIDLEAEDGPDTLVEDLRLRDHDRLLLETKAAGHEWAASLCFGPEPAPPSTWLREYQCPMALFDEEAGSVGEWSTVTFRKGATAGDVRAAARQLFAIPAEHATVTKVTTSFLKDFPLDDDASLSDCNLYSNSDLVVRDGRQDGEGTDAALRAALKSNEHSTLVYCSDVDSEGGSYPHMLTVPTESALSDVVEMVAAVLGKPAAEIKLYERQRELYHYNPLGGSKKIALRVVGVERGGTTHSVPIHRPGPPGDRDGGAHIFDMDVQEDIKVSELKERLAEKLRAEGPPDLREATGPLLRLREIGYNIFIDDQTVIDAVKNFAGSEKFGVSLLQRPEEKKSADDSVLCLIQFHPETFSLAEEPVEVRVATRLSRRS